MKKHFSIKNRTKFNGFQRELSPFDLRIYFLRRSLISVRSAISAGVSGSAGAASSSFGSLFLSVFKALMTQKIQKAMIKKSTIVCINEP